MRRGLWLAVVVLLGGGCVEDSVLGGFPLGDIGDLGSIGSGDGATGGGDGAGVDVQSGPLADIPIDAESCQCTTNDECIGSGVSTEPCLQAYCDPKTCRCAQGETKKADGTPCEDGDPCTFGTDCQGGACFGGDVVECDDSNPCTGDLCDEDGSCSYKHVDGECDDGDVCTVGDACASGQCASGGEIFVCDDANACTEDSCDPLEGCTHSVSGEFGSGCSDDNPCTGDVCNPSGGCHNPPISNNCDDGDVCSVNDFCVNGACVAGPLLNCSDGNPCTSDTCDPITGCEAAIQDGASCDDGLVCNGGDVCTDGSCEGSVCLCVSDLECPDDGNLCNGHPKCDIATGQCVSGQPVFCDVSGDGPCTQTTCVVATGECAFIDTDDVTPCNDDDLCTMADACLSGVCTGAVITCNDGDPCSEESCEPGSGACLLGPANGLSCEDGDPCTEGSQCLAYACVGGTDICEEEGGEEGGGDVGEDAGDTAEPEGGDGEDGGDITGEPEGGDDADEPEGGDDADEPEGGDDADEPEGGDDADEPEGGDDADEPEGGDAEEGGGDITGPGPEDGGETDADATDADDASGSGPEGGGAEDADAADANDPDADSGGLEGGGASDADAASEEDVDATPDAGVPVDPGSCCGDNGTPGCNESACEECVCDEDLYCCTDSWDQACANEAVNPCASACSCSDGCCGPLSGEVGCDNELCEICVCAIDSSCCTDEWTSLCGVKAGQFCATDCVCDPLPGGECCGDGEGQPGCSDVLCEECVCAAEPFCCETAWDATCGDSAAGICNSSCACEVVPFDCCLETSSGPACQDQACTDCVCAIAPYCCDVGWDASCVSEANASCIDSCGCTVPSDCCGAKFPAGCEDSVCEGCVCAQDSVCCNLTWDSSCATAAVFLCGDSCTCEAGLSTSVGDCCAPNGTYGCDYGTCEICVCAFDSFCCEEVWDLNCTEWATEECVGACPCEPEPPDPGPEKGDCCTINEGIGCDEVSCETCVCALEPICCDDDWPFWEVWCVDAAEIQCIDECTCADPLPPLPAGDCCAANGTPGCDDDACSSCVCGADSVCCTLGWDSFCQECAQGQPCGTDEVLCGDACNCP